MSASVTRCLQRAHLPLPTSRSTSVNLARTFSTTPAPSQRKTGVYRQPALDPPIPSVQGHEPQIPSYPYGSRQIYKQSNTGLYGNARIRFGNNVSEKWEVKNRRKWRPNVHRRRLWSVALQAFIQTRITTRVLRTVDKVGGLDEYLLGTKPARVKELGPWGWRLRWRLMQTPAIREKYAAERSALGLPERTVEEQRVWEQRELEAVGGESAEKLTKEIDAAVKRGDDIALGEDLEEVAEEFMREEKPGRV
ncbi:39S ribosomal protein L24, mitochondrial [Coniochaeta pulveracea]|uniref:Large ribosomal subunit protein bL28m n=1 Tax=Coniochaeta pulveracea TaxID=177199 RepID=A0A420Y607_9PEZI|nr:39S ribosomal protein L24, mitochondrial [Coniochaeta pulveracea]